MKAAVTAVIVFLIIALGGAYAATKVISDHALRNRAAELLKRQDYPVTIPEGKRREEIAQLVAAQGICSAADFMAASTGKEGYLFPDTYRFYKNTPASQVVSQMTSDFTTRTSSLHLKPETVVLASIVERESLNNTDRPLIAGIYSHRLSIGMKLQSDPTVEYGRDSLAQGTGLLTTYWKPITAADYQSVNSAYNTYLIAALPPTAIANPGLPSLEAAANPTSTDQLFFLYKNNKLFTSKTLQEHLAQE